MATVATGDSYADMRATLSRATPEHTDTLGIVAASA